MKLMFYTICAYYMYLCICGEKILHSKIKSISPEKTMSILFCKSDNQTKGDEIIKEEILEC